MFVTLLIKHSNIVFKIVNLRLSLIRGKSLRRSTCYERESDKRLHTAYTKRVFPLYKQIDRFSLQHPITLDWAPDRGVRIPYSVRKFRRIP